MSIRQDAINRVRTPLFEACARNESISSDQIMDGVSRGELVITKNKNHNFEKIIAIGKNVSTKINANIGSSKDLPELHSELQKLCVAIKAGADTVMDLSMGGDLDAVRRGILEQCPVPLGTVPIYQAVAETVEVQKNPLRHYPRHAGEDELPAAFDGSCQPRRIIHHRVDELP
jgi:phosphomethylpyrimidine synthase